VSAPLYRYVLWSQGDRIAAYKTLGQALLGAVWRSRKLEQAVGIYSPGPTTFADKFITTVNAS